MIQAAGGAVWRIDAADELQVLLVHRPRYDDWSLPKGKLQPGERHLIAALREVAEETGYFCRVTLSLPDTNYRDRKDRRKRVRYWAMVPERGRWTPNDEVDEIRWLGITEALEMLTYVHDRPVVDALSKSSLLAST